MRTSLQPRAAALHTAGAGWPGDECRFKHLLIELIDENPLAVRALLRILCLEFTSSVPTLAVTLESRPRLLVNLDFVRNNCHSDKHVKALICHEFLHVLLGHTERFSQMSLVQNLALDCVINAIIHRQLGPEYSSMMSLYYADEVGLCRLLRPMTDREHEAARFRPVSGHSMWDAAWLALYDGDIVSDDILDLARDMERSGVPTTLRGVLIGGHESAGEPLPSPLQGALGTALQQMNGSGIWRSPQSRGAGTNLHREIVRAGKPPFEAWRRKTFELLKECLLPDARSKQMRPERSTYTLPVLNQQDGRAFLRSLWSPLIPEVAWRATAESPTGTANVYLDVSGSMCLEIPHVIALMYRLRRAIRQPFWAFSTVVKPALIVRGKLQTESTGGTQMECVLRHIAATRPAAALVVTDGYIERLEQAWLAPVRDVRLRAIVTPGGSPAELERAGVQYAQLQALPK